MRELISTRLAGNVLLVALSFLAIFHILVLLDVISGIAVWGGYVEGSNPDLMLMESISLVVTIIFILIVAVRAGIFCKGRFIILTKIGMWVIFIFFLLNLIGNITSPVSTEKYIFAPLALILALLAWRLGID